MNSLKWKKKHTPLISGLAVLSFTYSLELIYFSFFLTFPQAYSILENKSHSEAEGKDGTKITFLCITLM